MTATISSALAKSGFYAHYNISRNATKRLLVNAYQQVHTIIIFATARFFMLQLSSFMPDVGFSSMNLHL